MAISYVGHANPAYSTANVTPASLPTHAAGDIIIVAIGTKPDSAAATPPAGWTLLGNASGGVGSQGIDTGPMRVGIFYKIATSSNESIGTWTITNNNITAYQIFVFRKDATKAWEIAGTGAADTTTGSPHSVTMPVNPGLTVGDNLLAIGVIPSNVSVPSQFSAETVSAPGMTTVSMTEISEWATASGQDMGGWTARGSVVTGTATGAPTVSATAGGTTTDVAGPIYLVRLREGETTANQTASDSGSISVTESSNVVPQSPNAVSTGNVLYNPAVEETVSNPDGSRTISGITVAANKLVTVLVSTTGGATATGTLSASNISSNISGMGAWNVIQQSNPGSTAQTATYVFYARSGGTSQTGDITVTFNGTPADSTVGVIEYGNVHPTPIGGTIGVFDTTGTVTLDLTETPTANDKVVLVVTSRNNDQEIPTVVGGTSEHYNAFTTSPSASQWVSEGSTTETAHSASTFNTVHNSALGFILRVSPEPKSGEDSGSISTTETASIVSEFSSGGISVAPGPRFEATTSVTTGTAALADGTTTGDWSIVFATLNASTGTITGPAGWDTIQASTQSTASTSHVVGIWAKKYQAGDGDVTVTSTSGRLAFQVYRVRGANSTTLLEGSAGYSSDGAATTSVVAPSVTATNSPLLLTFHSGRSATSSVIITWTAPDGMTELGEFKGNAFGQTNATGVVSAKAITAGSTGTQTATASSTATGSSGMSLLLNPAAAGDTPVSASDEGSISTTETTDIIVSADVSATDSGTISVTEDATLFKDISVTDSGTISTADASGTINSTLSRTDSGSISTTDVSASASTLSANDAGSISTTDASSIIASVAMSATDSGSISATESVSLVKNIVASDSGTLSVTDIASTIVSTTNATDSGSISTTESATVLKTISASDSGSLSTTETSSRAVTLTASDSGSISATESVLVFKTIVGSDSGSLSVTESALVFKTVTASDSGTISATDTGTVFNDRPGQDSGTISTVETANVVVTGTISKSGSDSGSLSTTESRTTSASSTRTDSGSLSATESRTLASSSTRTESGSFSVTEQTNVLVRISSTDSGSLSTTDISDVNSTTGTEVQVWNGSAWVTGHLYVWNGSSWTDVTLKRWNGVSWV